MYACSRRASGALVVLCMIALTACSDGCTDEMDARKAPDASSPEAGFQDPQTADVPSADTAADVWNAPMPSWWVRQFGTPNHDAASAVAAGPDGHLYVAASVDHMWSDGGRGSDRDGSIRRYDPTGRLVWEVTLDSGKHDTLTDIAVADGVYVAGATEGSLAQPASDGPDNAFVRKYTTDGKLLWTRQFGASAIEDGLYGTIFGNRAVALAVHDHAVYVLAYASVTCCGNRQYRQAYLLKFDARGERAWGTILDDFAKPNDLSVSDNGVYVAGDTDYRRDVNHAGWSALLGKYSFDGDKRWLRQFDVQPDIGGDIAYSVVAADEGAFVAAKGSRGFGDSESASRLMLRFDGQGNVTSSQQTAEKAMALAASGLARCSPRSPASTRSPAPIRPPAPPRERSTAIISWRSKIADGGLPSTTARERTSGV